MAVATSTVIAAAAVVSAGVAINNSMEQRKQARVARTKANFEEARSRRRVLAEAQVLRSQVAAQSEAQGTVGSSSVQGAMSNINQQATDTIGFQNQISSFNNSINRSQQRINNSTTLGDIAAASGQAYSSFKQPKSMTP